MGQKQTASAQYGFRYPHLGAIATPLVQWRSLTMESLQPSDDRGTMSVSQRNVENFWIGRHRPPLGG